MVRDWQILHNALSELFREINTGTAIRHPREVWNIYNTTFSNITDPGVRAGLFEVAEGVWIPRAYEALRLFHFLKQRMDVNHPGRSLVDQIRVESILRQRPVRDVVTEKLSQGSPQQIMAKIGGKNSYSRFQVMGWVSILETIKERKSIVIVGPTGSGKTETFLLPLVYTIARQLQANEPTSRFILVYPRVELLKDQVARILKYAHHAGSMFNGRNMLGEEIIVGLQYGGIGANYDLTFKNQEIFDQDGNFLTVPICPICGQEGSHLRVAKRKNHKVYLECTSCKAIFPTTLSRDALEPVRPHILVTNVESLDRLYLNPKVERYLQDIEGLVFDEVHLYHSLYGAHVSNLIQRIEKMQAHNRPLIKIGSSATVSHPARFASRLFYGKDDVAIEEHNGGHYPQEPAGLESVIFLQAPDDQPASPVQSTLIQTVMALWHGLLGEEDRAIVFTESVDHANRSVRQIRDAEVNRGLWRFRTLIGDLMYQGHRCPNTTPMVCNDLYLRGECWRGIRGGINCVLSRHIAEHAFEPSVITSMNRNEYWRGDVIVATSALEVGVDDERFVATVHYRPPHSVFSFLQRRGRAGRRLGDMAYTILVLGRTATDEFYFRRRNRLMDGSSFEIPINPQNTVVRLMHARLEEERENLGELYQGRGLPQAIMLWMIQKYQQCVTLQRIFGNDLSSFYNDISLALTNDQVGLQQDRLKRWVGEQQKRFEHHLNIEVLLEELITRIPATERDAAVRFQEAVRAHRRGDTRQFENIRSLARQIVQVLASRKIDAEDELEEQLYEELERLVTNATRGVQFIQQLNATEHQISALYDFFTILNDSFNSPEKTKWILNYAPDVLKIVLQSLFYIGNACLEDNSSCNACLDYCVPDAYFQEVKPILVETRTTRQDLQPTKIQMEDSTRLASMLVPYKPFYRYFSDADYMAIVRTTHNPDWVIVQGNQTEVRIGLGVEGIRHDGGINPRKVYVHPIRPDADGQGIVRLCTHCFAVYNENRHRTCDVCGNQLTPVKLHAEPLVRREAEWDDEIQISETFHYCERMEGKTWIHGAAVDYVRQNWNGASYTSTRNSGHFVALYYRNGDTPEPLVYSINTRGIVWNLEAIVATLTQNQTIAQALAQRYGKQLTPDLVLHTAAHMLHKAVAAISGVKDQAIEYAILPEPYQVVVWERYEGGIGISEIVRDIIRERPADFYREILASVLCPVFYSEQQPWLGDEALRATLADTWSLGEDDLLIDAVVRETVAERQAIEQGSAERGNACSVNDGCPACIHVTICTAQLDQSESVSRYVAEAIADRIRQTVDRVQLESINEQRLNHQLGTVGHLRDDIDRGIFDVVRL